MKTWLFAVIVVAVIIVGVSIGMIFFRSPSSVQNASPFAAVYLSTGDIYFGKLSWSPVPHMEGVWYLQKGATANGAPQYGISPFAAAFWGPVDEVYFNQSQIIFWTYLKSDSVVAKAMDNPQLFQQLEQQIQQQQQQQTPSIPVPATSTNGKAK